MGTLLNQIHRVLIKHKEQIFAEEKRADAFYEMAMSINQLSNNDLIHSIGDPDFINRADAFGESIDSPIEEFLIRKLDAKLAERYVDLIESRKMIWDYPPEEIATTFKTMGVGYQELCKRVRHQFFDNNVTLGLVMARSDQANRLDFQRGTREFSTKIQEDKREKFIESLERYF